MAIYGKDAETADRLYKQLLTMFIGVRNGKLPLADFEQFLEDLRTTKEDIPELAPAISNYFINGEGWLEFADPIKYPYDNGGEDALVHLLERFNTSREVSNYDAEYMAYIDTLNKTNESENTTMPNKENKTGAEEAVNNVNEAAEAFDAEYEEAKAAVDETAEEAKQESNDKRSFLDKTVDFVSNHRTEIAIGAAVVGGVVIAAKMFGGKSSVSAPTPDVVILDELMGVADNSGLF